MWCCRHFISLDLAKRLYTSLIEPYFIYGCIHYDGCSSKAAKQLQVAQNKAIHAVLSVDGRYPTNSVHSETGVPYLQESHKYHTLCFAYGAYTIWAQTQSMTVLYAVIMAEVHDSKMPLLLWSIAAKQSLARKVYCKDVTTTGNLFQLSSNKASP